MKGGASSLLAQTADNLGNLLVDLLYLQQQLRSRHPQHTAAQCRELNQSVGGCHTDGVVFTDPADERFNILVGALALLRVHDAEIALLCS